MTALAVAHITDELKLDELLDKIKTEVAGLTSGSQVTASNIRSIQILFDNEWNVWEAYIVFMQ